MIRHQQGNEYFLFTQDDHAQLSGTLAEQIGNAWFAAIQPRKQVIRAIAMHDCGWRLHDQQPTLDAANLPLHVFDTPIPIASRVWTESVRRVREIDAYAGLLVSIHAFGLSAMSYQHYADPRNKRKNAKELFELNKFQQLQIEVQEQIRASMGLRTDMPLALGLAPAGSGEQEDLLRFHYNLLKAMDQISLAVLCSNKPFATIEEVSPRPGADPIDLRMIYPAQWMVSVSPWPFAVERIDIESALPPGAGTAIHEPRAIPRSVCRRPAGISNRACRAGGVGVGRVRIVVFRCDDTIRYPCARHSGFLGTTSLVVFPWGAES